MSIAKLSYNDVLIDQLNLDGDEDDDAQDTMENVNQNESDIWEASNFFTPWV